MDKLRSLRSPYVSWTSRSCCNRASAEHRHRELIVRSVARVFCTVQNHRSFLPIVRLQRNASRAAGVIFRLNTEPTRIVGKTFQRMPAPHPPEHHKRVTTSVDDDDIDPLVDQQVRRNCGSGSPGAFDHWPAGLVSAHLANYVRSLSVPCVQRSSAVQGCGKVYSLLEVTVCFGTTCSDYMMPGRRNATLHCQFIVRILLQECLGENNRDWRLCQKGACHACFAPT